jgi:competence protein CoiA
MAAVLEEACPGLREGLAVRAATGEFVSLAGARSEAGRLICATCKSDVVARRCVDRRDHFAHAATTPVPAAAAHGESALHRACKTQLCAALAISHPAGLWAIERPIPPRPGDGLPELIPDLSGRFGNVRVAVEVQASALGLHAILRKTEAYTRRGIHVLWIIPAAEAPDAVQIRPKLYERYLHSLYFGRAYYWWPGLQGKVVPIHHGVARHAGRLKSIKTPMAAPALDLAEDFWPLLRPAFTPANERKAVPACRIWMDGKRPWW